MSSLKIRIRPWSMVLALPAATLLGGPALAADENVASLPDVTVSASKVNLSPPVGATLVDETSLLRLRPATSDTASLLGAVPGVSLYGAGGVSSLPAIHGLADDRLRIKVDGMDLISACANHMNPPLSYMDPSNVGSIQVFAGITPVSVGGDSIGGAIVVNSAAPEFAKAGEGTRLLGQAGAFYRSNGHAKGGHVSLTVASEQLSLTYSGASTEAGNYEAAEAFKSALPASQTATTVKVPGAKEVGTTLYRSENQSLGVALRHENHLLELKLGQQNIPYQGFPNQRMDMTSNQSEQINLRYTGRYQWGALEARVYHENTRHQMNFLDNKLQTGSRLGMPMATEGKNSGALVKADLVLSEHDTLRVGGDYQRYRLNDWWDPVTSTVSGMGPSTFWNIKDGQRDRLDVFAEWEARWNPQWLSQLGVRSSTLRMNTGHVQAYNSAVVPPGALKPQMYYAGPAGSTPQYAAFNALDRSRTDHNLDVSMLARYTPDAETSFEAGLARKTRSPNLYERFAWSSNNAMVMNMVNWSGDANGYVGNVNLRPETANTLSATADWHDAARQQWGLQVTPYYTYVQDYIDVTRCAGGVGASPCQGANLSKSTGFVYLQFANQNARLYGLDISGRQQLAETGDYGTFTATGLLSYVRGKNTSTDGNLYNIMPLNAKLAVVQRQGRWSNTVEAQLVAAKTDVSRVRNELETAGYGLLNLRSSYEWHKVRLDIGIENALDKFYASPLGGAYVGEGSVMGGGAWGIAVPGSGRSLYAGVTVKF